MNKSRASPGNTTTNAFLNKSANIQHLRQMIKFYTLIICCFRQTADSILLSRLPTDRKQNTAI